MYTTCLVPFQAETYPCLKVYINHMWKSEIDILQKKILFYEEFYRPLNIFIQELKKIFGIFTSIYDLYIHFNMDRFWLDRVCTKHVV
jgi:hypothetical protein